MWSRQCIKVIKSCLIKQQETGQKNMRILICYKNKKNWNKKKSFWNKRRKLLILLKWDLPKNKQRKHWRKQNGIKIWQ